MAIQWRHHLYPYFMWSSKLTLLGISHTDEPLKAIHMKAFVARIKRRRILQLALILVLLIFLISRVEVYASIVQRYPRWTGERFWHALRSNNIELAKALSDQSQWQRFVDWMPSHTVISCDPFSFDADLGTTSSYGEVPEGVGLFSKSLVCETVAGELYSFAVYGIKIERIGGVWRVTDWIEIDEKWS